MEPETTSILKEINAKLDSIQRSTAVLADVVNPNIGIERIWPDRKTWANDLSSAGMAAWKKRVCQAKTVDIVSTTFWSGWFNDGDFRKELFKSLACGTVARILIYDPLSDVLLLRARDEMDPSGQARAEINWTLEKIVYYRKALDIAAQKNLLVGLTNRSQHFAQVIRADDHILVAVYLSGKSGSPSPTFQVRGPETAYFRTYAEQIEILWERCRKVSDDEIRQIVAPPSGPVDRVRLHQSLTTQFSEGELRDLCFYLNVNYEDLPGEEKRSKARELIVHFERRDSLSDLIVLCRKLRPNVSWWDVP
jgi:hypothetical protein